MSKINIAAIEKEMVGHPEDYFAPEEAHRRMIECMSRCGGKAPTMNMKTGQNLQPPFLSEAELTLRGYPCDSGFE